MARINGYQPAGVNCAADKLSASEAWAYWEGEAARTDVESVFTSRGKVPLLNEAHETIFRSTIKNELGKFLNLILRTNYSKDEFDRFIAGRYVASPFGSLIVIEKYNDNSYTLIIQSSGSGGQSVYTYEILDVGDLNALYKLIQDILIQLS